MCPSRMPPGGVWPCLCLHFHPLSSDVQPPSDNRFILSHKCGHFAVICYSNCKKGTLLSNLEMNTQPLTFGDLRLWVSHIASHVFTDVFREGHIFYSAKQWLQAWLNARPTQCPTTAPTDEMPFGYSTVQLHSRTIELHGERLSHSH